MTVAGEPLHYQKSMEEVIVNALKSYIKLQTAIRMKLLHFSLLQ